MARVETADKSRAFTVGGPRVKAELVPEQRGARLYAAQLYTCHEAKRLDNSVRVHAFDSEHAQRMASLWLCVPPRNVCVARTEAELLSLRVA